MATRATRAMSEIEANLFIFAVVFGCLRRGWPVERMRTTELVVVGLEF